MRILLSACAVLLLSAAPVAAAPPPDFTISPATPTVGQPVTFTPSTTGNSGSRATADWDFQDDNLLDVRNVPALQEVTYRYPAAGTFKVRMLVRRGGDDDEDDEDEDEDDEENVTNVVKSIRVNAPRVAQSPASATAPVFPPSDPDAAGLSLMNPFPVVRLAGIVYLRGVKVRVLEVKAPPRSTVTVRCAGKGCPSKEIVKTARKKRLRFRAMTRFLWEETIISVSIRNSGQIGKYTSWLIRGGKLPKRKDRCLYPSRRKPARCPSA